MRKKRLSLSFIALTLFLSQLHFVSAEGADSGWSYSVEDNIEKSSRSYLLVHSPETPQERRMNVVSKCQKPYRVEGVYGTCTHEIEVQPTKERFTLKTGEDVVLVWAGHGAPLLLGTIEYGCCAGPDTVNFYTESGEYFGNISGMDLADRCYDRNLIRRECNFGNSSLYGKPLYFVVRTKAGSGYEALVMPEGQKTQSIPVEFTVDNKADCDDWYLDEFIKYGDRDGLKLIMKGHFCAAKAGMVERAFSCTVLEKTINCIPSDAKK